MKKHLNPPQNTRVFNKTAGIYNAANGSIFIGSILGFFTELAILKHIFGTHITEFWQAAPAALVTAAAAAVCLFLALERIRYGKEAAKLVTDPEARALGGAANFIVFAACFAFYAVSLALSYIGTIDTVNTAIKAPERKETTNTNTAAAGQMEAINRQYSADSAATAAAWKARIGAETAGGAAKINALKNKIASGKTWFKPELTKAQENQAEKIAALKTERAGDFLRLQNTRAAAIAAAQGNAATETAAIQAENARAADRFVFLQSKAAVFMPVLVCIALVLVLLGCYIVERFKYTAGIKEIHLPNENDLLPGIWAEYREAFKSLFSGWLRRGAAKIRSAATPAAQTLQDNTAELVKIELEKYKEIVLNLNNNPNPQPPPEPEPAPETVKKMRLKMTPADLKAAENSVITEKAPPPTRNYGTDGTGADPGELVKELFNTYRINRQRLQTYLTKQANCDGKPDTLQAGIDRHRAEMEAARHRLNALGFDVKLNKAARKLELIKID